MYLEILYCINDRDLPYKCCINYVAFADEFSTPSAFFLVQLINIIAYYCVKYYNAVSTLYVESAIFETPYNCKLIVAAKNPRSIPFSM